MSDLKRAISIYLYRQRRKNHKLNIELITKKNNNPDMWLKESLDSSNGMIARERMERTQ